MLSGKDLDHEFIIPAAHASFHDEAFLAGVLLDQGQRKAAEPGKVFRQLTMSCTLCVFAVGHVETPMACVFNAPVVADRSGKLFHAETQAADVIANLQCFLLGTHAVINDQADRPQPFPPRLSLQIGGGPETECTSAFRPGCVCRPSRHAAAC